MLDYFRCMIGDTLLRSVHDVAQGQTVTCECGSLVSLSVPSERDVNMTATLEASTKDK